MAVTAHAQADKDRVYLKNKSLILGKLVSLDRDSALVRFNSGDHWFETGDIHSINIKGNTGAEVDRGVLDSLNTAGFKKKFDMMLQCGVMAGGGINNRDVYPAMSLTLVYRFKKLLQLGLATGYEQYDDYRNMPVYLYYKGDLFRHFSGAYYYAGAGYSKMWGKPHIEQEVDNIKGGPVLKAGVGFIFASKSKVDFVTTVGWSRQHMEMEYPLYHTWGGEWKTEVSRTMDRLEFKIGICF
ncbi:hypothetical protein GCM10009122_50080 [Fulvivirga kasyanovii]